MAPCFRLYNRGITIFHNTRGVVIESFDVVMNPTPSTQTTPIIQYLGVTLCAFDSLLFVAYMCDSL